MTSPTSPVKIPKLKENHKLLAGVILVLGAVLVCLVFFSHRGLYQMYRFHQERHHLEQENARLKAENDRLARTIERLHQDPELIQDLIRRELNFVRKNEVIFQLPPEVGAKPQAAGVSPETEPASGPRSEPAPAGKPANHGGGWANLPGAPPEVAPKAGGPAPRR
jgi:cell division protein FtsB